MYENVIIEFFNHPLFIIVGGLTTAIIIIGIVLKAIFWTIGITPIIFRLGIALWKRNISIFSSQEVFEDLKTTLIDSKIFKSKKIIHIPNNNIDKAKTQSLFLIDWETSNEVIDTIFAARKDDQTAIVIYAKPASIPQEDMKKIANRTNTVVVNFRGRLLNDILTSLITTSYKK